MLAEEARHGLLRVCVEPMIIGANKQFQALFHPGRAVEQAQVLVSSAELSPAEAVGDAVSRMQRYVDAKVEAVQARLAAERTAAVAQSRAIGAQLATISAQLRQFSAQ